MPQVNISGSWCRALITVRYVTCALDSTSRNIAFAGWAECGRLADYSPAIFKALLNITAATSTVALSVHTTTIPCTTTTTAAAATAGGPRCSFFRRPAAEIDLFAVGGAFRRHCKAAQDRPSKAWSSSEGAEAERKISCLAIPFKDRLFEGLGAQQPLRWK